MDEDAEEDEEDAEAPFLPLEGSLLPLAIGLSRVSDASGLFSSSSSSSFLEEADEDELVPKYI